MSTKVHQRAPPMLYLCIVISESHSLHGAKAGFARSKPRLCLERTQKPHPRPPLAGERGVNRKRKPLIINP